MRIESVVVPLIRHLLNRPKLANAIFRHDRWGNTFSDEAVADPMIQADAMRKDMPIVWRALYQQWFILGYDEAREVLGSPHVGTANQVEMLLDVSPYTKLSPRSQAFFRNFLVLTDPPLHTRIRSLVNRAFTPRQVAKLDDRMNTIIDDLIAEFNGDTVELMTEFAVPFPAYVIAELLGIPNDEWEWVRATSTTVTELFDPFRGFDPVEMDATIDAFYDRMLELVELRRGDPRDDMITGLALAEADDGDRLSEDEFVAAVGIILFAGHETTAGMFGNALVALFNNPDQLELIRSRPALWPNAIEELLRFETSVRSDPRSALVDFEIAGHKIKKGQNLLILNAMANRDLRRFSDADDLRLDRDDPSPISFGHGIHYCLGANLARAELRAGLPKLLNALGDFHIDVDEIEWKRSVTLRSPVRLPISRR